MKIRANRTAIESATRTKVTKDRGKELGGSVADCWTTVVSEEGYQVVLEAAVAIANKLVCLHMETQLVTFLTGPNRMKSNVRSCGSRRLGDQMVHSHVQLEGNISRLQIARCPKGVHCAFAFVNRC